MCLKLQRTGTGNESPIIKDTFTVTFQLQMSLLHQKNTTNDASSAPKMSISSSRIIQAKYKDREVVRF